MVRERGLLDTATGKRWHTRCEGAVVRVRAGLPGKEKDSEKPQADAAAAVAWAQKAEQPQQRRWRHPAAAGRRGATGRRGAGACRSPGLGCGRRAGARPGAAVDRPPAVCVVAGRPCRFRAAGCREPFGRELPERGRDPRRRHRCDRPGGARSGVGPRVVPAPDGTATLRRSYAADGRRSFGAGAGLLSATCRTATSRSTPRAVAWQSPTRPMSRSSTLRR